MWAYFGGFRGVEMPFNAIQNHSVLERAYVRSLESEKYVPIPLAINSLRQIT